MLPLYDRPADVIRFVQPFRDFEHGRDHALEAAERRLGQLLRDSDGPHVVV